MESRTTSFLVFIVGEYIVKISIRYYNRRNTNGKKVNPQGDCKLYLNALRGIEKILSI